MLYLVWRIWWYYRKLFPSRHFFSKWLPLRENVNFVRLGWKLISWGTLMWQTWWKYWNFFRAAIFFKMAAISRNIHFVGFQWKFRSWGNLMWRTWWCYRNCFPSHHFFCPPRSANDGILLCFGSQVSDSGIFLKHEFHGYSSIKPDPLHSQWNTWKCLPVANCSTHRATRRVTGRRIGECPRQWKPRGYFGHNTESPGADH